jgi:hypothetical protein
MSSISSSQPHRTPQPASLLGDEHPLVVAVEDHRRAVQRYVAMLGLLLVAALATLAGLDWAAWVLASGAAVAVVLALSLWSRTTVRDDEVLALIVRGGGGTDLPVVRRARERLLSESRRVDLARALEALSGRALCDWEPAIHPALPVVSGRAAASAAAASAAAAELAATAKLIRAEDAGLAGLALAERLVTDGTSALYGDDERLLRDELARLRFLLRT